MARFNKKAILTTAAVIALSATLSIGLTLAYLTDKTETVRNKLTFVNGSTDNEIEGTLEEEWNPEDGIDLQPGDDIAKKPHIVNSSSANVSEFAAMQVVYEKLSDTGAPTAMSTAEVQALLKVMSINFNTTDWAKDPAVTDVNANGVVYFYNSEIAKGQKTSDLFTTVSIDKDADNADLAAIGAFAPGGINIRLEGAVTQAQNLTLATAQPELKALFN